MLCPNLKPELPAPLYQQLYAYIKEEIHLGHLTPGSKLPSKRSLANFLNISLNTVTDAYNQLVDEGYLKSLERKGYFVENFDLLYKPKDRPKKWDQEEKRKKVTYDFSFNTIDEGLFPYSLWRKAYREAVEKGTDFLNDPDPQGGWSLRQEIAHYLYSSRGVNVHPSQIVISAGTEFLFFLINQMVSPQSIFAVENPGYERLSYIFKAGDQKFTPIGLDRWGMRTDLLEESGASIACVTPSHQFPTGCIMPLSRRQDLLAWAGKAPGRYIVEDDYDSEFRYSGRPIPSLKSMDVGDRVIYMGSFSKSISPSLRISYMVLPQNLKEEYLERLTVFKCPVSAASQRALEIFIQKGDFEKHLNRMRNHYRRKRETLVQALKVAFPQAKIGGEEAGLHLLLYLDKKLPEKDLVDYLQERSFALRGLYEFRLDKLTSPKPCLVLGFGRLLEEDIEKSVLALKKAILDFKEDLWKRKEGEAYLFWSWP